MKVSHRIDVHSPSNFGVFRLETQVVPIPGMSLKQGHLQNKRLHRGHLSRNGLFACSMTLRDLTRHAGCLLQLTEILKSSVSKVESPLQSCNETLTAAVGHSLHAAF